MNLAFVHRPSNPYLSDRRAQVNMRKFFFDALPLAADVTFYGAEDELDLTPYADKCDAWIFFDAVEWGIPSQLRGVDKIKAPKVCMIGDCHGAEKRSDAYGMTKRECCEMWGFAACFFQHSPDYFYRFFPADWTYWWVPFGVDESLYATVMPFCERRFDKVLLTGVLGEECYPLRTVLREEPTIHYHKPGSYSGQDYTPGTHDGDKYKLLLEQWAASVASGYSVLVKHFEVPAAGCLSFAYTGNGSPPIFPIPGMPWFEHMRTAVFVDPGNALDTIKYFLETADDPQWEKLAAAGRRFVLENYTHRRMAERLVSLIGTLL